MTTPSPFTRQRPPLTDVAQSLRALADDVDMGRLDATSVVVVWPDEEAIVAGASYGAFLDRLSLAGLLAAAMSKTTTGAWE